MYNCANTRNPKSHKFWFRSTIDFIISAAGEDSDGGGLTLGQMFYYFFSFRKREGWAEKGKHPTWGSQPILRLDDARWILEENEKQWALLNSCEGDETRSEQRAR